MDYLTPQVKQKLVNAIEDLDLSSYSESDFVDLMEESMMPMQQFFSYYKCAIMEIETKFRVLDEQFSVDGENNPIEFISSRVKSYGSIMRKMISKGIDRDLGAIEDNIFDIAGVRVVCSFIQDIYKLADCLLAQDDIKLIKMKDYIEEPKPNGYRSLHLIVEVPIFLENEKRPVKVEVQLRTLAMDFWASLEHKLRYKKNLSKEKLDMLSADLKKCADESAQWDRKMQSIKNLLSEE